MCRCVRTCCSRSRNSTRLSPGIRAGGIWRTQCRTSRGLLMWVPRRDGPVWSGNAAGRMESYSRKKGDASLSGVLRPVGVPASIMVCADQDPSGGTVDHEGVELGLDRLEAGRDDGPVVLVLFEGRRRDALQRVLQLGDQFFELGILADILAVEVVQEPQ